MKMTNLNRERLFWLLLEYRAAQLFLQDGVTDYLHEMVHECPSCGTLITPLNPKTEEIVCRCGHEISIPKEA